MGNCSSCCCSCMQLPSSNIVVAKQQVSIWRFNGNKVESDLFEKGQEFHVINDQDERWWEVRSMEGLKNGRPQLSKTGYASKLFFYPKNFDRPEEEFPWYFGELTRSDAQELLAHETNPEGSYFVRYSDKKQAFILSIKIWNPKKLQTNDSGRRGDWDYKHFSVNRADKQHNMGQYYFSSATKFHTVEDLVEHCKLDNQKGLPVSLTNVCLIPNPQSDLGFLRTRELQSHEDLWMISRNEIVLGDILGHGHFGQVHRAYWRKDTIVAVKTLKEKEKRKKKGEKGEKEKELSKEELDAEYKREKSSFLAETEIMKKLSHPHLVKMFGICIDKHPFFLVQELCERGDLKHYLEKFSYIREPERRQKHREIQPPTFDDLLTWSTQISSGMSYLERNKVIHRDLAARNVLLDKNHRAKVADFGLSVEGRETEEKIVMAILWSSPESMQRNQFSHKSDVWSFGVTMWELFSFGERPYSIDGKGMGKAELKKMLRMGKRMDPPKNYTNTDSKYIDSIYEIMRDCWKKDPHSRPTFESIKDQLENFSQVVDGNYDEHVQVGPAGEIPMQTPVQTRRKKPRRRPDSSILTETFTRIHNSFKRPTGRKKNRPPPPPGQNYYDQ